ncbi:MAG: hypothetical protein IT332_08715 [Ardenticatenales bacterium]|nr:hypothetical protein [Ardenticatenales bacterium]
MYQPRSVAFALPVALLAAALALAAGALALPARPAAGQPAPLPHRVHLPRVVRAEPPYTSPPTARPTSAAPTGTPTASAVPTDFATPSPTETRPTQPGVPDCVAPKGDAGGFRFSLDGGRSLSPGAQRLAPVAYTWAIDIDPRDPDHIVELHAGQLFHSHDAGCTFTRPVPLPALGGDATGLTRAAAAPDTIVLHSIFSHNIAVTDDGGRTWAVETLPDDVVALAIAPDDAVRWTFVGREGIYLRTARDGKWEPRQVGGDDASLGGVIHTASPAPGRWGTWLVGGLDGIIRTTDDGLSWHKVDATLRVGSVGTPPEPITVVVGVWLTHAPGDADVAYAAVNQVSRGPAERSIWRSGDGGLTWDRRVVDGQPVPADAGGTLPAAMTGATRVFVSPHDPDAAYFTFGLAFGGYGTDLFRSSDGLATLNAAHFTGFYEAFALAWGPKGSDVLYVGASSDLPSVR